MENSIIDDTLVLLSWRKERTREREGGSYKEGGMEYVRERGREGGVCADEWRERVECGLKTNPCPCRPVEE